MKTATSIRTWGAAQLAAIIVLLAIVGVLAFYALRTHDALCNFKDDIARRHEATSQLVADIREGRRPPIPGITPADLDRSVANLEMTITSLSDLDCG